MKTFHRSAFSIVAWTLVLASSAQAQNSSSHLASNSRGYNPAYGQVGPTGYQAPSPQAQYYAPGEYLPTPGSRPTQASQPSAAPAQNPGLPQSPFAYPSAPSAKTPAPAPTNAPGKPIEDLEALRRENQLLNERLRAQQAQDTRGYLSPPGQLSYVNHTVRRGDSLWGLAIKYKTSSTAIQQANNLPKGKLLRGATIRIPVLSNAAAPAPRPTYYAPQPPQPYEMAGTKLVAPDSKPAVKSGSHTVKSGETLGILAQHYGVSLTELKNANQLRSAHRIYVGQRLVIPGRSEAEVAELSKKSIPTAALSPSRSQLPPYAYPGKAQPYAPIVADTATPKEKAAAPKQAPASPAAAAPKASPSNTNRGVTSYRIQDGDTLPKVAKTYKISPAELRDFNRLPSDQLPAPGKTLLVPTPAIVSL